MLIGLYKKRIRFASGMTKEAVIEQTGKKYKHVKWQDEILQIDEKPSSFQFWKGRGRIDIHFEDDVSGKTIVDAQFVPRLFTFDLEQIIFLILLGVFGYIMSRTAQNIDTLIVLVFVWIAVIFIAPYLMFIFLLAETIIFLVTINTGGLPVLLLAWILLGLVTHLELIFNRNQMRRELRRDLRI